ncbi:hypothetical protein KCU65_g2998, partial [Aureobasidium melanogenum]
MPVTRSQTKQQREQSAPYEPPQQIRATRLASKRRQDEQDELAIVISPPPRRPEALTNNSPQSRKRVRDEVFIDDSPEPRKRARSDSLTPVEEINESSPTPSVNIAQLEMEKSRLERAHYEQNEETEQLKTLVKRLESEKRELGYQNRDLRDETQDLKQQIRGHEEDNENFAEDMSGLEEENGQLKELIAKLEKEKNSLEEQKQAQKRRSQLQSERNRQLVQQHKEEIHKAEKEVQELKHDFKKDLQEAEREREALLDEISELKGSIVGVSRLGKQFGDGKFKSSIDRVYHGIRNCFLTIVKSREFDLKPQRGNGTLAKLLSAQVPGYQDQTVNDKLHVCMTVVSMVLVDFANQHLVFGHPSKDLPTTAWAVYQKFSEIDTLTDEKPVKQWLALTDEIINKAAPEAMKKAKEGSLKHIMDMIKKSLQAATTLKLTDDILNIITRLVSGCLEDLRLLEFQEWKYKIEMIPAHVEGEHTPFDLDNMEDIYAEESGLVKASVFPLLSRLEIDEEDGSQRWAAISKAKVVVMTDSLATDGSA